MNEITTVRHTVRRAGGRALIALLLSTAGLTPAIAAEDRTLLLAELDAREVRKLRETGAIMSLETLLKRVGKDYPGRVIEIELEDEKGRHAYEMEIVDDSGRVWEIKLDAGTGELLERERDD